MDTRKTERLEKMLGAIFAILLKKNVISQNEMEKIEKIILDDDKEMSDLTIWEIMGVME